MQVSRGFTVRNSPSSLMQLTRKKTPIGLVGLDIEAGSVAAAEVTVNGSVQVKTAAIEPLAPSAFHEGEIVDPDALTEALKELFSKHKLSKRVRLGLGSQGVVVRTMRLPVIEDPKELAAAVRFQAQEEIPMPLEQAILEHQVVGGAPGADGATPQIDVVVVAARRETISAFLQPLRRAGLEPAGIDLAAFGMIRALAGVADLPAPEPAAGVEAAASSQAILYCSVGDITNLAVARGRACLFTRVSHAGLEPVVARLAGGHGLVAVNAEGRLAHVGLELPVEQVEGDPAIVAATRDALELGVTALVDELRLSLDYYRAQEGAVPVERILLCGPGTAIPGLPARVEAGLGLPLSSAVPPALGELEQSAAARLTVPYGLALED
jgi:type IV pilus assembly protein PilM